MAMDNGQWLQSEYDEDVTALILHTMTHTHDTCHLQGLKYLPYFFWNRSNSFWVKQSTTKMNVIWFCFQCKKIQYVN